MTKGKKTPTAKGKIATNGATGHQPAELFDDDDPNAPESESEGDVVERLTISSGERSVTLTADQLDDAARVAASGLTGSPVESFTPTRKLKCLLTVDELAERASQVDANFAEIEEAEHELDAHARRVKSSKAKIESLIEANRELARVRREGYEYRDVPCEERRNDRVGCMDTVRLDTGETIDSRALTATERQGDLFAAAE